MRVYIGLGLGMLFATSVFGQPSNPCDPRYHWLAPSDCVSFAQAVIKSIADFRGAIAEESAKIAEARRRFWATYPDKPGAAAARQEFATRLYWKDWYYVYASMAIPSLQSDRGNPIGSHQALEILGGQLDGGIRKSAGPEFQDWAADVGKKMGPNPLSDPLRMTAEDWKKVLSFAPRFLQAMEATQKTRDIYVIERDWAEFDAVGREPIGLEDPALYFPALCVRFQKIKWEDAITEYNALVKALGTDPARKAIQQVHAAPKANAGLLLVTAPDPVKRTPSGNEMEDPTVPLPDAVIGVTSSPIRAVEQLATKDDDRRYLLRLLTQERLANVGPNEPATKWLHADAAFKQFVLAYGEPDILQAARLVRTATKRMTSGGIMNQAAIGAARPDPYQAFEDIIARNNPRGYVRILLTFNQNLKTQAEVDAAYKSYVSKNNEAAVLAAAGKLAVEKPSLALGADLDRLDSLLDGSLSLDKPVQKMVDFEPYLVWKGFSTGSKASYVIRALAERPAGSGQLVPLQAIVRQAFRMDAIDGKQTHVWITEIAYDPDGTPHPPHDREMIYEAKVPEAPPRNANTGPSQVDTGREMLDIKGRKIATRWESVSSELRGCTRRTLTWTSEEVPTELVRKIEETICKGQFGARETILESFDGVRSGGARSNRTELANLAERSPNLLPASPGGAAPQPQRTPPGPLNQPFSNSQTPQNQASQNQPPVSQAPAGPPMRDVPSARVPPSPGVGRELQQRYSSVVTRAMLASNQVTQVERRLASQGLGARQDLREARDRVTARLREVNEAMRRHDTDQIEQKFQDTEAAISIVEKLLGR